MKQKSLLQQIRPRSFQQWRVLPIFGPLLDDFLDWMHDQNYTIGSTIVYLQALPRLVGWLRRRQITMLTQLTLQNLKAAHNHFRPHRADISGVVRTLERFLRMERTVPEGDEPTPTPVDVEIDRFAAYLRETRGVAEATVSNHSGVLRAFLRFLRFNGNATPLQRLDHPQIEAFLRKSARSNNRFSMQHIVATVRAYLKERHAQGILSRPLHLQIDTPRVYRGERLPRALPWAQVQALIQSIDRSNPFGRRDFTLLYLAAAYGLRSSELVHLTLDDIDWRGRTLRVKQTKTGQRLQLPLTDEAANVLIDYLRKARPESSQRQLFLRMRAPLSPLKAKCVNDVLEHRLQCSGLDLPPFGTHVLRHSFATRLMKQGVGVKVIGDALGHRDIESTSIYLRLNVDDLRDVALPVPATFPGNPGKLVSLRSLPKIKPAPSVYNFAPHFRSRFAPSLQRFVDLKRALGRIYAQETRILRHWDDFVHRQHPKANEVCAAMFTGWAKTLNYLTSTGSRCWQRTVRNFLLFHARDHIGTFIPDRLTFPKPAPVVSPRLISEVEMGRVLAMTRQLSPTTGNPLRAETFYIGFILLFCCGLRCGELIRLTLGDIQEEQTVLHILPSKFHKSRWVPLSPSVTSELRQYLQKRRQKNLPMAPETFLMCSRRRSPEVYKSASLMTMWHQVCVSAHVLNPQGHPPRVHDLRHSAAVLILQHWYAQGTDVQAKLPYLATYLGHVNAVSTHHYLKLTPELRQAASERFHQRFAPLFTEGGVA